MNKNWNMFKVKVYIHLPPSSSKDFVVLWHEENSLLVGYDMKKDF